MHIHKIPTLHFGVRKIFSTEGLLVLVEKKTHIALKIHWKLQVRWRVRGVWTQDDMNVNCWYQCELLV